jgi:uncharacterized protein YjiS (DUF1127 family)
MTWLEAGERSAARAGYGTLCSTTAALTSPVQGLLGRAFYGDVAPLGLRVGGGLGRVLDTLSLWQRRARQRRELAQLDDHMLRDIGITRADALAEAGKVFWRS